MNKPTESRFISARKHPVPARLSGSLFCSALLLASGVAAAEDVTSHPLLELASAETIDVLGYNTNGINAVNMSSGKFTQPLVDTPQTLVVIKKELFEQQAATTLSDAMRNTPGITLLMGENGNTATGDAIFMRGFDTQNSIFVDGIRDLGTLSRDVYNIEQIEVAKGPAGVDNGRGAASGYVNLSSKKATLNSSVSVQLSAGSADFKRATLDINTPLTLENAALRINAMKQDAGQPGRDAVTNNLSGLASSLGLGLGTDTQVFLNLLHNEQNSRPDGGIPTVGLNGYYSSVYAAAFPDNNGPDLSTVNSRRYFGAESDINRVEANMVTLRIEHQLNNQFALQNTSRYGRSSQHLELTGVNALVITDTSAPDTWEVARTRQGKNQTSEILTNQTNLNGSFQTGDITHEIASGIEFIHEQQWTANLMVPWLSPTSTSHIAQQNANLWQPDTHNNFQPLVSDGTAIDGQTTTAAAYAMDTLTVNPHWELTGAVRTEHFYTRTDQIVRQAETKSQTIPVGTLLGRSAALSDSLFSWKLGLVYKPGRNSSIYLSTATSQLPPGGNSYLSQGAFALNTDSSTVTTNSASLAPQTGKNLELGTKWNLLHNKISLTAALFRSSNTNELVTNPDTTVSAVGERKVEGLELGLVGNLTTHWQINTGLALMDPRIEKGSSGSGNKLTSLDGGTIQWSPKRSFTLWNSYEFQSGLHLGAGVRYMDSVVSNSAVTPSKLATLSLVEVPEYWVADAMLSYPLLPQAQLQINLFNLADTHYLASVNNAGSRYYPGTPRSVRVGLNLTF